MSKSLQNFVENFFQESGQEEMRALDLSASDFDGAEYLIGKGWRCWDVDVEDGIDLEGVYITKNSFDLVFSSYVLHRLKDKEELVRRAYENLKKDGYFFISTISDEDKNTKYGVSLLGLRRMLERNGFSDIGHRIYEVYDNKPGHKHYHKVIEVFARK